MLKQLFLFNRKINYNSLITKIIYFQDSKNRS